MESLSVNIICIADIALFEPVTNLFILSALPQGKLYDKTLCMKKNGLKKALTADKVLLLKQCFSTSVFLNFNLKVCILQLPEFHSQSTYL